jgi:SAM-dependent MidA family methyltransferase
MSLAAIIRDKILESGPMRFYDFMEMSLYYPDLGYYTSPEPKIGTKGDFYTSSCLTPAFGYILGRQMEEMWALLDKKPFTIVEYGAGNGALCLDILDYLSHNPSLFRDLQYCILEKSPGMRNREENLLKGKPLLREKVTWHRAACTLPGVNGCFLSNELIDNFSVHQVVMRESLMEVWVDYSEAEGFVELLRPATVDLMSYVSRLGIGLPDGFRTEINLEAIRWMGEVASALERGYVITIDYGCTSEQLYADKRRRGTLMCYNKHTVNEDYYDHIGEQDITSHVNFSALSEWGGEYGLQDIGLLSQAAFLLKGGLEDFMKRERLLSGFDLQKEIFLKRKLLISMGDRFKVLFQQKGGMSRLPGVLSPAPAMMG